MQLSSMKKENNKKISNFAGLIEKISDLTHALTLRKTTVESSIIAQIAQARALIMFIIGVHFSIRTIHKASNIGTFELAVVIAIEEKNIFKDTKPKFDRTRDSKSTIKCNRCSKIRHYINECRSISLQYSGFINHIHGPNFSIKQENTRNVKFCKYCERTNPDIKDCRKRIFNKNKKKQDNGSPLSNSTNSTKYSK